MAQTLGSVAVGSIVKLNENGSPVNYIVVHQGKPSSSYDSSCDGTWLLRQDIAENRVWDSGNSNVLESSDIQSYLNNTWINRYDTDIRNAIKQVKIPYRQNGGSGGTDRSGANGLSCKIFLLSGKEVGWDSSDNQYFPNDGAKLSYFLDGTSSSANQKRVATLNGSATFWWLRSPDTGNTNYVWGVRSNGGYDLWGADDSCGVRPALVLPSTLVVTGDGLVSVSAPPPNALTVPTQAMQGNQISVSWSAVDGADSYILERKANTDSDWVQVYSGANTSFEETVGTWTSVQYRVKAGVSGTYGDYTTSASVPVVSASALVISGTDGDLGILTNDVQYSISSDQTSPTIDVTVEVNDGEYAAFQATSGQTYSVSVLDLPTGTGSIVITATTEVSSSPVTVTRTWTYSKTAPTFAEQGGLAQLTQQGANIWPKTIAEAVRAPGLWGGNLGLALGKLAGSVLYNRNQVAKYAEVTVSLAGKSEGDIIQLPENGRMVDFYVAKLDYESGLNGTGRVLLVRKNCYDNQFWDTGDVNAYASSDIDAWLNGTYKALLPQEIQTAMGTTKFYYTPGNGNNTVTTLERAVFALSLTELGKSDPNANIEGATVPIANTIQIAYKNGNPTDQWTRSPNTSGTAYAWKVQSNGSLVSGNGVYYTASYVPCFTLPTTFTETYYVDQSGRIHDAQEYEEAGTFTDISGGTIPMVSIETGSYVGTGTSGSSNPNTLTFPFEPKAVFIVADIGDVSNSDSQNATGTFYFFVRGAQNTGTFGPSQNTDFRWKIFTTWGTNSISWYRTAGWSGGASGGQAQVQMNRSGITYYYVAIG